MKKKMLNLTRICTSLGLLKMKISRRASRKTVLVIASILILISFIHIAFGSDDYSIKIDETSTETINTTPPSQVQIKKNEIFVILHIPKTSGTHWYKLLTRKLFTRTSDNVYTKSCHKKKDFIKCKFNNYGLRTDDIFRRHLCNIHSSYSDLVDCITEQESRLPNNTDIQMITFLREPVKRYISQIYYLPDGLWIRDLSEAKCPNFKLYNQSCNTSSTWESNTWQKLLECDYNRAINQQVRMLADYNKTGCDVLDCWLKSSDCSQSLKESNENKMLESAKKTLKSMKFFGLTEYQELSEYLFEKTFDNKYKFSTTPIGSELWNNITWYNFTDKMDIEVKPIFKSELDATKVYDAIDETDGKTVASREFKKISAKDLDLVSQLNSLDIELYKFAKDLFFKRIKKIFNLSQ